MWIGWQDSATLVTSGYKDGEGHLEGLKLHVRVAVGDGHRDDPSDAVGPKLVLHRRHLAHLRGGQDEVPLLVTLCKDPADLLQPAAPIQTT